MASVPNMRPGLAPAPAAPPGAAPVDGGEFARRISLVPDGAQQSPVAPDVEDEEAPAPESGTPADPAAIIVAIAPLLEAQVAAPAPKAEPAAEAPVVIAAPVIVPTVETKARKAPQPQVATPEAELPLSEGDAKPLPVDPREKEAIAAAKRALDAALQTAPAVRPAHAPAPVAAPIAESQPLPDISVTAPTIAPASVETAPLRARETAAPTPERALDLRREGEWLDRLARDIAQAAGNEGTIRFRLHPQTLGHLRVELSQGDYGTSIRLTADTEQARAILAEAQPRLAAEARAQGVRIAETHVDLSGSERHFSGDPRRQDDARQTPLIRTARAGAAEADASERRAPDRSDRFA